MQLTERGEKVRDRVESVGESHDQMLYLSLHTCIICLGVSSDSLQPSLCQSDALTDVAINRSKAMIFTTSSTGVYGQSSDRQQSLLSCR